MQALHLFFTWISVHLLLFCVCVCAHARACVKERQRRKERKSQRERESDSERENECVRHIFHTAHRATGSSSHVVYNIDYVDTHTQYNNRCTDIQVLYAQSNTEFQFSADWGGDNKHNTQQHTLGNTLSLFYGQMHIHTHTHTCAGVCTQAHVHTHTHTHTQNEGRERQIAVFLAKEWQNVQGVDLLACFVTM